MMPLAGLPGRVAAPIVVCLVAGQGAGAQDVEPRPLVGDRPDFTESAETIERGRIQVETGITRARLADGEDETAVGEVLARIGLSRSWELRLGAGSWVDAPGGDGFEDPSLGFKVKLIAAEGARPDLAVLFGASVPVGSAELTADQTVPEVTVAAAWEPTERLGLGANVGWARAVDGGERYDELTWSVAAGVPLGGDWGGFLELYGFSREEPGGDPTVTLDLGLTRLLRADLQLDARVGFALDDGGGAAADWFVGVGAVARW